MGKWSHLKSSLPAFENPDSEWMDKVRARSGEIKAEHGADWKPVVRGYEASRGEKDALDSRIKELNVEIKAYEILILDRMDGEGASSIRTTDGALYYVLDEPRASVEDRAAVRAWFEEHGMAEVLAPPWQTLNAICKDRLERNEPLPPGVRVFMDTKLGRRKG